VGAARKFLWVALMLGASCAFAQQKQMHIQFAEPVKLKANAGHSQFDAYGRRFSVDLQRNERLVQGLPVAVRSQLNHVQLLRGELEGVRGSWVRLTQVGANLEGAIWDGQDVYVVTTLARISKNLTTPIDELRALHDLISSATKPVIVAGDFNTFWGTHEIYLFMRASGLRSANSHGLPSYPARSPRVELDFILVSRGIEVTDFRIPEIRHSDHRPLICDFEIRKQ